MKKVIALILIWAVICVVSLTGCNEEKDNTVGSTNSVHSTPAVENTEKPASTDAPTKTAEPTLEPEDNTSKISVGEYFMFGKYEQDNNKSNGAEDIEWLVLDVKEEKALVISKYSLDCKVYGGWVDITWEESPLREWLNDDFINSAFDVDEQKLIQTMTITADKNPQYDTDPGNDTQDKVFLLSINEANKYFADDSERWCQATEYAIAAGAEVNGINCCHWWLRSPGAAQALVAEVSSFGDIALGGLNPDCIFNGVRPALWIDLNS